MSTSSHNPLRREFWLGTTDSRPLALFRIAIGLAVLQDLLDLTRDFRAFLTDDGMFPRSVPRPWWMWSFFDMAGTPGGVAAVYAFTVLAVVAFTVGYQTRIATVASWACLVSLHHRNYLITDGGDDFVAIMFFWAIFADLSGSWSVDARRPGKHRAQVPAFPLRILQANVAVLYFVTARLKLRHGWLQGTAIFQALQFDGFLRPFGAWLEGHPALCTIGTYSVLAAEFAFPFFAFSPIWPVPSRAVALALGLGIQLGIATAMRVGIFQEAMLASCALFVLPEWIDVASRWLRARGIAVPAAPARDDSGSPDARLSVSRRWVYAFVALQFAAAYWDFFAARRIPLPRFVHDERALLALDQPGDLFGSIAQIPYWDAPGVLADGSPVEVLGVAAPGARARGPGISFSRWTKFTFKARDNDVPWPSLGSYLCRVYDERETGARLSSFRIVNDSVAPRLPGAVDPSPPEHHELWTQQCE